MFSFITLSTYETTPKLPFLNVLIAKRLGSSPDPHVDAGIQGHGGEERARHTHTERKETYPQ